MRELFSFWLIVTPFFFVFYRISTSDADGGLGANISWLPLYIEVKHNAETMEIEIRDYNHVPVVFIELLLSISVQNHL